MNKTNRWSIGAGYCVSSNSKFIQVTDLFRNRAIRGPCYLEHTASLTYDQKVKLAEPLIKKLLTDAAERTAALNEKEQK